MHDEPGTAERPPTTPGDAAASDPAGKKQKAVKAARKLGVTVIGVALLATGLAMMVLPGPGLIVIVLGLFVLSMEFDWAEKRLDQARDKALKAAHKTAASRTQTTVAVLSSCVLIAVGVVLGLNKDLPLSGWFTGGTLIVSGLAAMGTVIWSVRDLKQRRSS